VRITKVIVLLFFICIFNLGCEDEYHNSLYCHTVKLYSNGQVIREYNNCRIYSSFGSTYVLLKGGKPIPISGTFTVD